MNSSQTPLVSIITVVRNGESSILATLKSVQAQQGIEFEHIIIDGKSSDGTVDVIKINQHDRLRWISEPDQGIYDAMNKGISMARGEWILFLGADDILADSKVLMDIFEHKDLSSYDLICGPYQYQNGKKKEPRLDWRTMVFNTLQHQAAFYHKRLFINFRYRLDIPVVADYELNFLLYLKRHPILYCTKNISICGINGVSHATSQIAAIHDTFKIRHGYLNFWLNTELLIIGYANLALAYLTRPFLFEVNRLTSSQRGDSSDQLEP